MNKGKTQFISGTSSSEDWQTATNDLINQLNGPTGTLGILYTGEKLAAHLNAMSGRLREKTGIVNWICASGYGVISGAGEFYGQNSSTVLVLDIPENGFKIFGGEIDAGVTLASTEADWIAEATMPLAITHADPRNPDMATAIQKLVDTTGSFLVGGLTATANQHPHQADTITGCLSGVALSPAFTEVATALSQGCTPLGTTHIVTRAQRNLIVELDDKPALDVFLDQIGSEFAENLQRISGVIFLALPVSGSDTADYTVRNLVGIDPTNKIIAIAETVSEGDPILICRRDKNSAIKDMRRMATDLKNRIGNKTIRGGLYISCAARGPNQFDPPETETEIIRQILGDFPIVGFFANGELNRDRIYAYTGVLTLFL